MTLMRWNPWTDLDTLQNEMQKIFDARAAESNKMMGVRSFEPAVDIMEDSDKYTLKFDLPEVMLADIHIEVENQTLTVQGERKMEKHEDKKGYSRIERAYGAFTRTFSLPNNVNADKITAVCKDGVLRLELPKKAEAQPRKIAIKPVN